MKVEEFQNDIVALARIHELELRILVWEDNKLIAKLRMPDGRVGFLMYWENVIARESDCTIVTAGFEYLIREWKSGKTTPKFTTE